MSPPRDAVDWSAYCGCGISWSYAYSLFEGTNSYLYKSLFSDLIKMVADCFNCVVTVFVLCLFLVVPWVGL